MSDSADGTTLSLVTRLAGQGRAVLRAPSRPDSAERERTARLIGLFDRLRTRFDPRPGRPEDARPPIEADIRAIETDALANASLADFFARFAGDGDLERAAVGLVRDLIGDGDHRKARSFSQVLQRYPDLRAVGDICLALVTIDDPMPATAWALLGRTDPALVLRLVPAEYFRLGFVVDPPATTAVLRRTLRGELAVGADAAAWLDIARSSFAAGAEEVSEQALDRAEALLDDAHPELRSEVAWLRPWYGRAAAADAARAVAPPAGEIPFALVGYRSPDRAASSADLDDFLPTLATLTQLARHSGLRFTGPDELVEAADAVSARISPARRVGTAAAKVRLYEVDRDVTGRSAVPDGIWVVVGAEPARPVFGIRHDVPPNPALRPLYVAFTVDDVRALSEDMLAHLRRYAPIGCRDWATVCLLLAADVPAFLAGCPTVTLEAIVPAASAARVRPKRRGGIGGLPDGDFIRDRSLGENLVDTLRRLDEWRAVGTVRTGQVQTAIAARSLGIHVDFQPPVPDPLTLDGIADDGRGGPALTQRRIEAKLAAALGPIVAGAGEDEVYAAWRAACAADVATARARLTGIGPIGAPRIDVAAARATVRGASVIVERSQPGPPGAEMNVEFSLDGNFKHQLDVVLDSIVAHASRPIRAFVLCRDHGPRDHARMAGLFPTVSFVWLPTDGIDYGPIAGMIGHITVATMDRLLLPELLPEVDRILHHDLDALCMGDLAELYDVDLTEGPVAARDQDHPHGSGFASLRAAARRMAPDRAREFLMRTSAGLRFDFTVFNAGVMVLDLAQMRADEFCRNFLPFVERFGLNDQAVLNAYAGSRRVPIAARWNRYPRYEIIDDAQVIHWLGPMKPWRGLYLQGRAQWRAAEARFAARAAQLP